MKQASLLFALANNRTAVAEAMADERFHELMLDTDVRTMREAALIALDEVKTAGEQLGYAAPVIEQAFGVYGVAVGNLMKLALDAGLLTPAPTLTVVE